MMTHELMRELSGDVDLTFNERTIKGILEGEISFPHRGGASLALDSRETGLLLLQLTQMSLNIRAACGPDCVLLSFHIQQLLGSLVRQKAPFIWTLSGSSFTRNFMTVCRKRNFQTN